MMTTTKHDRVCLEKQILYKKTISTSYPTQWGKRTTHQAPIHETHVYRNCHQHWFTEEYNPWLCKNTFRTFNKSNLLGFDRCNPSFFTRLLTFTNGLAFEDDRMIRLIDGENNQDC